ncbi:NADPH-dependent FMN reductase [Variovorax dokdonensis]|uniref:NADPH-dependent FMN reductase n=1 Tax=Variovorax dokdonensis TaxID=344883 RepID=A0ABT7N926_9BURK|nr:NADPH-dependent FMN reductase [Variovorax dokdonensis]
MSTYDVAVLVGSLRRDSINRKLANAITRVAPPSLRFRFVSLDELPMYNGDLEANRPEAVNRFTAQCAEAEAFLFVMPEFNRSLPAVLKNAIDWGSKPMDRNVWRDKPAAMSGTSPGAIGTAVGQQHLRQILGILGASVLGGEAYLSFKPEMIDAQGDFADDATRKFLATYMERFAVFVHKLVGA